MGKSSGYVRQCSAKSDITGNAYVGGIAGEGLTVTDCRSMVQLTGSEKTGAVLGMRGERSGFLKSESTTTAGKQTKKLSLGTTTLPSAPTSAPSTA